MLTHVGNHYLIDTSRVNAQTKEVANGKVVEGSFGFGWNLCFALIKSLKETRLEVGDLPTNLESSILEMLGKQVCKPAAIATPTKSRRRCAFCVDSLPKGPRYKKRKDNLKKHATTCIFRHQGVCQEHSVVTCKKYNE